MSRRHDAAPDDGFEAFVLEMSTPMLRTATFLSRDRASGSDLVQEALIRTYAHWGRAKENPKAYAWTTLLNLCRDQHRQRSRRPKEVSEVPEVPPMSHHIAMAEQVIERLELDRVISLLPGKQREVVVLRYLVGMSVIETADVLKIPVGTVKSAASRAIAALRTSLERPHQEVKIHVD